MKQYVKNNQVKTRQQIVIIKDGMRTINPTEEQILADGWEVYVEPVKEVVEIQEVQEPKEEESTPLSTNTSLEVPEEISDKAAFVRARHILRNNINKYDVSSNVNAFYYGDRVMWLDKSTRAGLLLRFQAEKARDLVTTSLWYNGVSYPLNVDVAIQMLYAIELYASACYDNTQRHLAAIAKLKTIEEVEAYDYKAGYPEKLRFQ